MDRNARTLAVVLLAVGGTYLVVRAAIRLAGALLIEQNDEWLVCRRYLSAASASDDQNVRPFSLDLFEQIAAPVAAQVEHE